MSSSTLYPYELIAYCIWVMAVKLHACGDQCISGVHTTCIYSRKLARNSAEVVGYQLAYALWFCIK